MVYLMLYILISLTIVLLIRILEFHYSRHIFIGVIIRLKSLWIGIHYSKYLNRTCINLLPCITIWIGNKPSKHL